MVLGEDEIAPAVAIEIARDRAVSRRQLRFRRQLAEGEPRGPGRGLVLEDATGESGGGNFQRPAESGGRVNFVERRCGESFIGLKFFLDERHRLAAAAATPDRELAFVRGLRFD